jgi:hypothetical protein
LFDGESRRRSASCAVLRRLVHQKCIGFELMRSQTGRFKLETSADVAKLQRPDFYGPA